MDTSNFGLRLCVWLLFGAKKMIVLGVSITDMLRDSVALLH